MLPLPLKGSAPTDEPCAMETTVASVCPVGRAGEDAEIHRDGNIKAYPVD